MNNLTSIHRPRATRVGGFSLVELMVAVVIGLIGIIMMFQVASNADQRRRTTAAGSDAQVEGAIALYNLERDIKQAGYGFGGADQMGCTVNAYDSTRSANFQFTLAPIEITDGGGGAPDQLAVLYGGSAITPGAQNFTSYTTTTKSIATNSSRTEYLRGDLAIAAWSATQCQMVEITNNTNADARTIDHTLTAYNDQDTGAAQTVRYNASTEPSPIATSNDTWRIYNLGFRDRARRNVWQITNNRTLAVRDDLHFTTASGSTDLIEVAEDVIDLQAQYGLDTSITADFIVDAWQSTAPADWGRLIATRVALLARSKQFEKENVTTVAPSWAGGSFTMTNVDGTADDDPATPNNWRRYRYRVYESVVPLRNAVWGSS